MCQCEIGTRTQARRDLKGMTASAPTPDEMERDDNHETASLPAPTKNTSIMQVRFPPHAALPAIPLQHNPHSDPSAPRPNPAAAARLSSSFVGLPRSTPSERLGQCACVPRTGLPAGRRGGA